MDIFETFRKSGRLCLYPGPARADHPQAGAPGTRHALSRHPPLWAFVNPDLRQARLDRPGPVFTLLPAGCNVQEATRHTGTLAFAGAVDTPELAWARSQPGLVVFVFEPDPGRFRDYLSRFPDAEAAHASTYFIVGDLNAPRTTPLSQVLAKVFEKIGFPAWFVLDGMEEAYRSYLGEVIRQTEALFYREQIYPLEGQWLIRSAPVRDITRERFYDQELNLYENLTRFLTAGNLAALKDCMPGTTAVLIGGSPDLDRRFDALRRWKDRALLIAVNRALPALHAAGIEPHFAVVNDNSLAARELMNSLPRFANTILACHSLSPTGEPSFGRVLFFASVLEEIFGERPWLPLHGSVLTTTFSLARFLGCARCVVIGGQLASHDPQRLSYARELEEGSASARARWEPHHPYLAAVETPAGQTLYTTPNFLDAALWFRDEIRTSGLEVVNLAEDSILFGPSIVQDEGYEPPPGPDVNAMAAAVRMVRQPVSTARLKEYIAKEMIRWRTVMQAARGLLKALAAPDGPDRFAALLQEFDRDNTTYLLERFPAFSTRRFHALHFAGTDPDQRREGARYYLTHAQDMARGFLDVLVVQMERLGELAAGREQV